MNLCSAANRVCDLYLCSGFSGCEGREGRPGGQRREGEDALGKDIWLFIAEVQPPACQRCLSLSHLVSSRVTEEDRDGEG